MIDKRIDSADNSCLWNPLQLPLFVGRWLWLDIAISNGQQVYAYYVEQVKGISKLIFGVKHERLIRKLKSGVVNVIFRPITI